MVCFVLGVVYLFGVLGENLLMVIDDSFGICRRIYGKILD